MGHPNNVSGQTVVDTSSWPTYRHDERRTGSQAGAGALSVAARVASLAVRTSWHLPESLPAFSAAPIVYGGRVYVGSAGGRVYALDAMTLAPIWQFPQSGQPPLLQQWHCSHFPSNVGIASSAAIARIGGHDAVIVGAPDNSIAPHFGSGRLFALDAATGRELWASDPIAIISDTIVGSTAAHEQIGYSSPLVYRGRVYIGIADACADRPVQAGRMQAVDLTTGRIVPGVTFRATGNRGGGIWSSPAAYGPHLFVTTGNARCIAVDAGCPTSEPVPDYASSIVDLDTADARVVGHLQPVPFSLDRDADFGAGAAVVTASCGVLVVSVQKDGYVYSARADRRLRMRWRFPATHDPFNARDGSVHVGDARTNYTRPAATWNDLIIVSGGGAALPGDPSAGHGVLHALDACASDAHRVRWMLRVPGASTRWDALSAPSVSGGIVFIGVNDVLEGSVVALADIAVTSPAGHVCSVIGRSVDRCHAAVVPVPTVLARVRVDGGVRTEPVLAYGSVYITTANGYVDRLSP